MSTIWDRLTAEPRPPGTFHGIAIGDTPTVLNNCVVIGRGCDTLPIEQGDIAIATGHEKGKVTSIRLSSNGEVRVNECLVGTDREVMDGLRRLLYDAFGVVEIVQECSKCHRVGPHPVLKGAKPTPWHCPVCSR